MSRRPSGALKTRCRALFRFAIHPLWCSGADLPASSTVHGLSLVAPPQVDAIAGRRRLARLNRTGARSAVLQSAVGVDSSRPQCREQSQKE